MANLLTPYWTPIKETAGYGLNGPRLLLWDCLTYDLARNIIIPAGRRAVKSLLIKRHLVRCLFREHKHGKPGRYFFAGPTIGQVKRIAFESTLRLVPPDAIRRAYLSKDEMRIVLKSGAQLWFVGLDVPQRIEGDEDGWDGGAIDEAADIANPDAIPAHVEPAMSTRDGWLILAGVPDFDGPNSAEYHKLWLRSIRWDTTDKLNDDGGVKLRAALREAKRTGTRVEYAGFSWPSDDIMPKRLVEYYSRRLSPRLFRQEIRASWESAPGRAYEEFNADKHIKPTAYLPTIPVAVSCDFNYGFHNWNAYQITFPPHLDNLPMFRAFEQIFLENATVYAMVDELARQLTKHDPRFITTRTKKRNARGAPYMEYRTVRGMLSFFGDYSGLQRRAESTSSAWQIIRDAYPDAEFNYQMQGPIINRINETNNALCASDGTIRTQIDPVCVELADDLTYVTRNDLMNANKQGRRTHASDEFGYLILQFRYKRATKGQAAQLTNAEKEYKRKKDSVLFGR